MAKGIHAGVFHHRVIEARFGVQGFLFFGPALGGGSGIPHEDYTRYSRVPFSGTDKITTFNDHDVSVVPHLAQGNKTIAGGRAVADNKRGAFTNGGFRKIAALDAFLNQGVFEHTYIDGATLQSAKALLALAYQPGTNTFSVRDAATGAVLSVSGDALPIIPSPDRHGLSADGRQVFVEFDNQPSGESGVGYSRYVFDVDLPSAQAVSDRVVDATPFGQQVSTGFTSTTRRSLNANEPADQHLTSEITHSASFPITKSVNESGSVVTTLNNLAGSALAEKDCVVSLNVFGTVDHVDITFSGNLNFDGTIPNVSLSPGFGLPNMTQQLVITGGTNKTFIVNSIFVEGEKTVARNPGGAIVPTSLQYEGTFTYTIALNVIYSDPAIPILVYEHVYVTGTSTCDDSTWVNLEFTASVSETTHREVGVLSGAVQRVLFTDHSSMRTVDAGTNGPSVPLSSGVIDVPVEGGSTVTTQYNTMTAGFPLFIDRQPLRRMSAAVAGEGLALPTYALAVKSADDWILGVTKSGALNVYAGSLDEADLKQRVINYLIEAYTKEGSAGSLLVAADLTAGNLAPYSIFLGLGANDTFI